MEVSMTQNMYSKGAPKSVPCFHRIPMNSIPNVGQLRDVPPMVIGRTHILHLLLH